MNQYDDRHLDFAQCPKGGDGMEIYYTCMLHVRVNSWHTAPELSTDFLLSIQLGWGGGVEWGWGDVRVCNM